MTTCPQCYLGDNPANATECRQCGFAFDRTADRFHRPCPSGKHQMDPNWAECAFCKAEGVVARSRTLYEGSGRGESGLHARPAVPLGKTEFDPRAHTAKVDFLSGTPQGGSAIREQSSGRETRMDDKLPDLYNRSGAAGRSGGGVPDGLRGQQPGGKGTMFGSGVAGGIAGAAPAAGDLRRIVGVLVTYTWKPEGQIFAVREGRNRIGRDPQCDIVIEQDNTLSAENSSIAYRTRFVISDKDSMCGTYVDGRVLEEPSFPLSNYSTIRAGSTTFTFIAIEQPKVDG